jgi:pyruvate-formate lyase-activating enzyme
MFRETRLGVKVGSHQECESIEEPTNIRNTNDNATSLVFFSGLVVFLFCRGCNLSCSFRMFPFVI